MEVRSDDFASMTTGAWEVVRILWVLRHNNTMWLLRNILRKRLIAADKLANLPQTKSANATAAITMCTKVGLIERLQSGRVYTSHMAYRRAHGNVSYRLTERGLALGPACFNEGVE